MVELLLWASSFQCILCSHLLLKNTDLMRRVYNYIFLGANKFFLFYTIASWSYGLSHSTQLPMPQFDYFAYRFYRKAQRIWLLFFSAVFEGGQSHYTGAVCRVGHNCSIYPKRLTRLNIVRYTSYCSLVVLFCYKADII